MGSGMMPGNEGAADMLGKACLACNVYAGSGSHGWRVKSIG